MKSPLLILATALVLSSPNASFAQAPNLGAATGFAVFTGVGAFVNVGATTITGDAGTGSVAALTGLAPAAVIGNIHVADATTVQAALAVNAAYASMLALACDSTIGVTLGNNQVLPPKIYCLGGSSTLTGDLILDAQGNPDAIFIFKIGGAFSTGTFARIILQNGASLCNVYWQVTGSFILGGSSDFKGTVIAEGAISLLASASLEGRALATVGAIDTHANTVTISETPISASITAGGATAFCANTSVLLSGNNNGGTWSTGAVTPSITVTASGNYYITNATATCSLISNTITVDVTPLPTDFGDLLTTTWPVAFTTLPSCQFTGNEASPYDAVTNPYIMVWAGNSMSSETTTIGGGNLVASTDAFDDGLDVPAIPLNSGYTYPFTVTLRTNTTANAYYRLWFDWNNDGNFSNDLDGNGNAATYAGMVLSTGVASAVVQVKPPFAFSTSYKVRLIVTDVNNTISGSIPDFYRNGPGGSATPAALISLSNGEVEDYNAPALILPVKFGSFSAVAKNCNVYLAFSYLAQQNNQHFIIEQSNTGNNWKQLAILGNTGNSGEKNYSYLHTGAAGGSNYYRVKQVDANGDFSYSKTVMVVNDCAGKEHIVMFPNPVGSTLSVILPASIGKAELRIFDAVGRLVSKLNAIPNMNPVATRALAPGIYLFEVLEASKVIYSKRLVKE
ncbi:MAG: ice-binding family protein [Chitinophagaceae bacterium]